MQSILLLCVQQSEVSPHSHLVTSFSHTIQGKISSLVWVAQDFSFLSCGSYPCACEKGK